MPNSDVFENLKSQITQILEHSIITHEHCSNDALEQTAVRLYICSKSYLDHFARLHQWFESARNFVRTVDEMFPGVRSFSIRYQEQDDDDGVEELAAMLEVQRGSESEEPKHQLENIEEEFEAKDANEEEESDDSDLLEEWDFDDIMTMFS